MKKQNYILAILILILMLLSGCSTQSGIYVAGEPEPEASQEAEQEPETEAAEPERTEAAESDLCQREEIQREESRTEETQTEVCVYVCGAVREEGVYYVPAGTRKQTVFMLAGGYDENAVRGYVNLAEPVLDGERIYFPSTEEVSDMLSVEESTQDLGPVDEEEHDSRVNINTAGKELLMTLPGIGEGKAKAILEYRTQNGNFKEPSELMNVSGIKEGIFDKIEPYITVK